MNTPLRVVHWNANGPSNHKLELLTFLDMHKIDIALISETHFTSRTIFKIPHYSVYHSIHPDDTEHGGVAVILRSSIRHHELLHHQSDKMQAATIRLDAHPWPLTISAIYCPPRHVISPDEYMTLFRSLGSRFLIGGDWNAKHTAWGPRLTTPKGRNVFKAISSYNCHYFSTGEPSYWPTDLTKLPDLLDVFVARGIPANYIQVESAFELSSDHSPVIATIGASIITQQPFQRSPRPTPTGICSVITLTNILTSAYASRNMQSKTKRHNTSPLYFKQQRGIPHFHPAQERRLWTTLLSTYASLSLKNDGRAVDGNGRETRATESFTTD
jgi:exonuclease III